jgi:multimeric flavodoxin WrbA
LKTLLIVWYSRTGASEALAAACAEAARLEFGRVGQGSGQTDYQTMLLRCDRVDDDTLNRADGLVFVCPENLGSMAGAMKEFFDRHYYSALGKLNGRAYACIVAAGSDGAGAVRQMERIAQGWRLKAVAPSVIVNTLAQTPEQILAPKRLSLDQIKPAEELGQLLAAGLMMGIY